MSNLTGSANFLKYMLFLLNLLFVLTGIIIISVGATVQGVYHGFPHFLSHEFYAVPTLLIVIGSLIFFISFLGCCGAVKENYCMIISFAVLLGLIFILEFAAGISGYVLRSDTEALLTTSMNYTMSKYNDSNYTYLAVTWDEVQQDFKCCGIQSYKDWELAFGKLPVSCCLTVPGTMETATCNATTPGLFSVGCVSAFGEFIRAHAVSLGAAGLFIAFFQLLGIFATCFVARKIRNGTPSPGAGHNQF